MLRPKFSPLFISSISKWTGFHDAVRVSAIAAPASALWPSASLGIYIPFYLRAPFHVKRVFCVNGTAVAGNVDIGVYGCGEGGGATAGAIFTLAGNTGTTAQAGTSAPQYVALTTPVMLQPGRYYMAISTSSASSRFFMSTITAAQGRAGGFYQQASVNPLPTNTTTFAAFAQTVLPLFGLTQSPSGH